MQVLKGSRESLLTPLTTVSGIIETHQTVPILSNVLIQSDGSKVSFTGSNLEIQIKTHAELEQEGDPVAFTVSSRKIQDLIKSLPPTEVTISLGAARKAISAEGGNQVSQKMEVSTENSRFSLQTIPADKYPSFPDADFTSSATIPAKQLKYILSMVHYAMANQDIRFYLNAVRLVIKDGKVRAVATDGRRLAFCEITPDKNSVVSEDVSVTIPRKAVLELKRLLPEEDDDKEIPVKIDFAANQARFTFNGVEVTTKLLEGTYPDYERVIPTNNDKGFLISREALLQALQRTAVLASDKFKGVRWLLSPGLLSIQSSNSDQEEGNDNIAVDYQGDPIDIGFNIDFLSDVLSNLKNDKVKIALSGPQGSALITMPESDDFKYVLMPMRL